MSEALTDVLDREIKVGDRVGCAFSYSQASVGTIRTGVLMSVDFNGNPSYYHAPDRITVTVRWDGTGKESPKMKYGDNTRWVLLS